MKNRQAWLNRLANLNVARTERRGLAPHKPLLLLTIMDMIEEGILTSPWVGYSPELFFRFSCYWQIVYDRQQNRPDMRLPFHALGGHRDRVWERFTEEREPSRSKETTRLCQMNESLWDAMQDPAFRRAARIQLVAAYFDAR
jgi:putative restriction endonuclease